jgi:hypothetical protein
MSSITTSALISEFQNTSFGTKAKEVINGWDLNYRGNTLAAYQELVTAFSIDGTDAIRNKVMLWLVSSNGDYVREPEKGGPLVNLIGRALNEQNAIAIKQMMTSFFEDTFNIDLNLVGLTVTPNAEKRRWELVFSISDPIRRELFDIAIGVKS